MHNIRQLLEHGVACSQQQFANNFLNSFSLKLSGICNLFFIWHLLFMVSQMWFMFISMIWQYDYSWFFFYYLNSEQNLLLKTHIWKIDSKEKFSIIFNFH
jgi:hypothetical protein